METDELKKKAREEGVPIIQDAGLSFLLELIEKENCRDILELGTAVGYSSIAMASLRKDIVIDTVEKDETMIREAEENIRRAGLEGRIILHALPIEEFHTDKKYDLIFVDAAKAQYGRYTEQFLDNLKEEGVMVYDNMIFHGMIYHPDDLKNRGTRSMVRKILRFRESVQKDERFDIMMYDTIGDGIMVLRRSKS